MKKKTGLYAVCRTVLGVLALTAFLGPVKAQSGSGEETFPVLTIGTQTYTNVTVTTKARNYVMLMHSSGLANIKVSELTPELRDKLGYGPPPEPKMSKSQEVTKWAKAKIATLKIGQVQALEANFRQKWAERSSSGNLPFMNNITPQMLYGAAGGLFIFWLILCACLRTICKKSGKEPGFLIWLPLLQIFPMLNAARMSAAWVLGCFGLTQIVWCFKIAKARGKSAFTGFCLLFPLTSVLAFLYLTLSDGAEKEASAPKRSGQLRIMTLETA